MSLRVKILVPLIAFLVSFIVYMEFVWAPEYLGQEKEDYITHYMIHTDLIAKSIAQELKEGEFSGISSYLDRISADYPLFLEIKLEGQSGEVFYHHASPLVREKSDLQTITAPVPSNGKNGLLTLVVDVNAQMQPEKEGLREPLQIIGVILLVVVAFIALLLNRWIGAPLAKLAKAAAAMEEGYYSAQLPAKTNDEIGVLVKNFDEMRHSIATSQWELRYEINERREAEARLEQAANELVEANAELDRALIEAQSANHQKSQFLAMMGHEVRTPMNGIIGMLEILRDTPLDQQNKKFVDMAYNSARVLLNLLNNVLDYSKIESGRVQLESVDFNPANDVQEVVGLMKNLADSKKLYLKAELSGLPAKVHGDPFRYRQIITNLISNAIKFTHEGGITIRGGVLAGQDKADVLRIEIKDTGIGLTTDEQGKIFEAFMQADNSISRRYGGTGLGLAICRQLVSMMGGYIGVTSAPGEGSCFWFTLPVQGGGQMQQRTAA